MKIGVVGLWHLGEIYSACLAQLGNTVIGIDTDSKVVANLNRGIVPLPEPDLEKIVAANIKKGRLHYTTDFRSLKECDVLWITFDTPVDENDSANTKEIFTYIKKSLPYLKDNILIITSSQLPVESGKKITNFIKKHRKNLIFDYAYIPENLRLGEAVESFMKPSRIVIGVDGDTRKKELIGIFEKLETTVLTVNVQSAEMIKHATNAYLSTSLSFIYDIADICETVGADITQVAKGLRADTRIGMGAYLDASAGFSGGHLTRDLQYLQKIAKTKRLKLPVITSVIDKNTNRPEIIFKKLTPLLKTFKNKTVTFLGLTYKSGTPTLVRSLPLMVAKKMLGKGAHLNLCDPFVDKDELKKEMNWRNFTFFKDPYKAVCDADAIICITPWGELKKLDFAKIGNAMKSPKLFFDARNYFLDEKVVIEKSGINYIGVGR